MGLQVSGFGRSLRVRHNWVFCLFFSPFLKKLNKHIPRSLLLLPFKGCIFVSLFTFVDLVLVLAVLSTIFYCKK